MKVRNKKVIYTIIGIAAVILITIGITYAYWLITKNQTKENLITSACLDISLTNEANDITLANQFPISDEEGLKLTPYTFTVTNNCNTSVDYNINLESIGESKTAVKASSIKAVLNENKAQVLNSYASTNKTIEDAYEAYILGRGTLAASGTTGSSVEYSLRLWIDVNAPISEMNKTFRSRITAIVGQGISSQGNTLASLILEDARNNNYLYSTTPDFSQITEEGEYGLYSAQDDFGTSYYFRGDVDNNYVEFGEWQKTGISYLAVGPNLVYDTLENCETVWSPEGVSCFKLGGEQGELMYWRIVRINGDGTIRLVYDGTELIENGTTHNATISLNVLYNSSGYDNKSAGYTYDVNGVETDSVIKTFVDTWYVNNLKFDYGKYLADSIFCNDREVTRTTYYDENFSVTTDLTAAAYSRVFYAPFDRLYTNKSPVLTCTNQSDRYTVEDTTKGNGLLSKPIGLMTADEVAMAGGGTSNSNYYLYSGEAYWSMTPLKSFELEGAETFIVDTSGAISTIFVNYTDLYGARPVINLKANTLFTGSGTIDDPYVLAN